MARRRIGLLAAAPLLVIGLLLLTSPRPAPAWAPFRPDETLPADCARREPPAELGCLRQAYANLAWDVDAAAAMRELWADPARALTTLPVCHRIAHLIGEAVWERRGGDLTSAVLEISEDFARDPAAADYFLRAGDCVDGLFHGLLEREFADRPDPEEAIDSLALICDDRALWSDNPAVSTLRCVHGIGHGTMIVSDNRIDDALALCDRIERIDPSWPDVCASGVFMEYAAPTVAGGSLVDAASPFADCERISSSYVFQCYTHVIRAVLPGVADPDLADLCSAITVFEGRAACAFEVGMSLAERSAGTSGPLASTAQGCLALAPHLLACLNGALEEISHAPDPLLAVARACGQLTPSLHYACGIVTEVRRDWRELSPSGCEAIDEPRVRAGCVWSRAVDFDPRAADDPPLIVE